MSEWKIYNLSSLMEIIGGGTPKTTKKEYWNGNIPWLSVVDFNTGRKYVYETEKKITEIGFRESSTKYLDEGDIIISARGTVGALAILGRPMTFNQSCYGLKAKNQITNNSFLYYLLKSAISEITSQTYGAVFDTITKESFDNISALIPPLPEQERIAEVLSSLDDKIDLLHRNNKTLEQLAEALFRQWFVEEAEESWEELKFSDIVNVKYGKDHKKLKEGIYPVYGSGGLMRHVNAFLYDKESVLIPRKGTLSNIIYVNAPFWSVDTMFYTEMKRENIAKFVFHYILNQDLASMNVGSAVPSMTTEILNNLPFLLPPSNKLLMFDQIVGDLYERKEKNNRQIMQLENLRDLLLPKLMSGAVRVVN